MKNKRVLVRSVLILMLIVLIAVVAVKSCAAKHGGERTEDSVQTSQTDSSDTKEHVEPAAEYTTTDNDHLTVGFKGSAVQLVRQGDPYTESGAFGVDDRTGPVRITSVKGDVDTSRAGDYSVVYTFDSQNAHKELTRTVRVVSQADFDADTNGIPVMMYHYVYTETDAPESLNSNYILNTDLEAQLAWLKENDYYFPSYSELRAYVDGRISLPSKSVMLTFDDAQIGFLAYGIPLLEKYEIPATSFVIGIKDGEAKIKEYASPYIEFESHSYDMHKPGGNIGHGGIISALSKEEIISDLEREIAQVGSSDAFAYPFGDVTDDAIAAVTAAGIKCSFTTVYGYVEAGDDPAQLTRIRVIGSGSLDSYISTL